MIKARWSRRLGTLLAVPVLACGSLVAMAFTTALPAHACGTIPISGSQSVYTDTPWGEENMATVQLWYNGCTAGNRFVYATMNFDDPTGLLWDSADFTLTVGIEDELGNFPFGKAVVHGHQDGFDCSYGCQAIAHAVNIDYYAAPKKFRAWAELSDYPGCDPAPIATDWWEFSTGTNERNGVTTYTKCIAA
ncbi:hypothetical protein [Actinoallomurus sp. CA-150999]|uniref:hypothetical protein n=1 Tax=Actinoallomurus sp. CA-150999 TaxID=3239887 RepID=UPI003D8AA957